MRSFLLRETSYFSITWAAKRSNCFEQVWHENIPRDVLLRLKFGQFIASHLMRCGVQILVVSSQFFSWMRWWIWCMDCEACKDEKVKIWKLNWKDIPVNLIDMTHWACQKWRWMIIGQDENIVQAGFQARCCVRWPVLLLPCNLYFSNPVTCIFPIV